MLNDIKIQGYLGRDPELSERQGQNGPYKSVAFSLGVGRDFGDGTDWFRCIMNGKRAEVIDKYFSKGDETRNVLTEFNSNNTRLLNVEETKAKIASLPYIRDELAKVGK